MKDRVDILGSPSLIVLLMVFVDVKQHYVKKKKNLFCPNMHWFRQNVLFIIISTALILNK